MAARRQIGREEGKLAGYDYVTFREENGHTTVVMHQMFALPVKKTDLNLASERQDNAIAGIFQNLKTLV